MGYIESITDLLEVLHRKATYIACKATGYDAQYINCIYFDYTGGIWVKFKWTFAGDRDTETDTVFIMEDDFSDVDKGAQRIKELIEHNAQCFEEKKIKEENKKMEQILAQEKIKYLELKAKFETI